jgi:carboxypeptidase family protein
MKLFRAVLTASLLLIPGTAYSQGVGASGSLRGTVTDPTGALIPNASIVVRDTERGARFTATADSSGQYRVASLAPGTYDVTAQSPGFGTVVQKSVVVSVGGVSTIDFNLPVAQASTAIEVSSAAPVIDTIQGKQADTINQNYVENLPINRRDYLSFTLLLPGVSDSTRVADDQDFRVKQTPTSGLSFYGSNGRGNSITVDGGDTGDDAGGVRLTVSQDAVREFQVNRSNYSAELGTATGASVNIVTKSGTNTLQGTLYGFFRNDALDARDPFAFSQALQTGQTFNPAAPDSLGSPIKNALGRQQYGGTIGFPIKKDKTFLFLAFEGLRQDSQNSVPLLTSTNIFRPQVVASNNQVAILNGLANEPGNPIVPCINNPAGGVTSLPAATCAGALQSALTISQSTGLTPGQTALNNYLVNAFESNGGVFPYNTRQYLASGRLDHQIDSNNQLSLEYRYGHDLEQSPDVQSLTGYSAGSSVRTYDSTASGSWIHTFSPAFLNELRAQWSYDDFNVIPNAPAQAGLQIAGYANNLGTNIFLPNFTILRRYNFADNVTLIRGHHTMRFGFEETIRGNHTQSHTFFPGRFVFGSLPGSLLSPCLGNPGGSPASAANPGCGLSSSLNPVALDALQTASLGLPQVYQQGFGNPDYGSFVRPLTAGYWQDSWTIWPNFTVNFGLRYELDSQYAPLSTDKDNFAPRISFAWDPFKDHKTVIRGGYGIFYGPIDAQIPGVDYSLGVLNANKTSVDNTGPGGQVVNVTSICGIAGVIPGSGTSPCNRPISIYIDPITATGLPLQNSAVVFQTLFAQGKIGCTTPAPGAAACITPQDLAQFGINVANSGPLSPLTVLFTSQRGYQNPYAQQASFGIEREVAPGLVISGSYVYVHTLRLPVAIDTNLLPAPYTTVQLANGSYTSYRNWNTNPSLGPTPSVGSPNCAGDLLGAGAGCFVNPLIIQNNQYSSVSSALYQGAIFEIRKRLSHNFTLLGNYTFSKAFDTSTDFNTDYGPQDPTNLAADRALSSFDERQKVVAAAVIESPWKNAILRGFELSPIAQYHSGHPFNLLAGEAVNGDNHPTNGRAIGANRNTGLGPNYASFDMRLSRTFKIQEKTTVQLLAEGFNLFNRTNYASVNNEVGPNFGLPLSAGGEGFTTFNVSGTSSLSPSQPLGFTSALPKRQIQLGARLTF